MVRRRARWVYRACPPIKEVREIGAIESASGQIVCVKFAARRANDGGQYVDQRHLYHQHIYSAAP
jgi:hypothetical protein